MTEDNAVIAQLKSAVKLRWIAGKSPLCRWQTNCIHERDAEEFVRKNVRTLRIIRTLDDVMDIVVTECQSRLRAPVHCSENPAHDNNFF
jgi:hypothetical protein